MPVAELLQSQADQWRQTTRHAFVAGVRDGTVTREAFDAWLVQDAPLESPPGPAGPVLPWIPVSTWVITPDPPRVPPAGIS